MVAEGSRRRRRRLLMLSRTMGNMMLLQVQRCRRTVLIANLSRVSRFLWPVYTDHLNWSRKHRERLVTHTPAPAHLVQARSIVLVVIVFGLILCINGHIEVRFFFLAPTSKITYILASQYCQKEVELSVSASQSENAPEPAGRA